MVYSGWSYRKSHTLTLPEGVIANHPYQITVMRSDGESSGQVVYIGTKCKSDFSDIRFADFGENELPYFISKKTADMCIFWVKIFTVGTGSNTIYMYYGNTSASSESDGESVFPLFFDSFDSFDAEVWNHSGADTPTCSDSVMTLTASCGDLTTVASFLGTNIEYIMLATLGQWSGTQFGFRLLSNPAYGGGVNTY